MTNYLKHSDQTFAVGDTLKIGYKIKEGDKEREQIFTGILIAVKGDSESNRMLTVRRISKSGIGIERIIPSSSPYLNSIKLVKKGTVRRAKLYFVRGLSDQKLRHKIYKSK